MDWRQHKINACRWFHADCPLPYNYDKKDAVARKRYIVREKKVAVAQKRYIVREKKVAVARKRYIVRKKKVAVAQRYLHFFPVGRFTQKIFVFFQKKVLLHKDICIFFPVGRFAYAILLFFFPVGAFTQRYLHLPSNISQEFLSWHINEQPTIAESMKYTQAKLYENT